MKSKIIEQGGSGGALSVTVGETDGLESARFRGDSRHAQVLAAVCSHDDDAVAEHLHVLTEENRGLRNADHLSLRLRLGSQVQVLEALFNRLVYEAAHNLKDRPKAAEIYLRMAMLVQRTFIATSATLAAANTSSHPNIGKQT